MQTFHATIALMYQFKLLTTKHHTNWKEHTSLGNAPYNYVCLNGGCHLGLYKPIKLLVTKTFFEQIHITRAYQVYFPATCPGLDS